jgi:thioredoxin-related protein
MTIYGKQDIDYVARLKYTIIFFSVYTCIYCRSFETEIPDAAGSPGRFYCNVRCYMYPVLVVSVKLVS